MKVIIVMVMMLLVIQTAQANPRKTFRQKICPSVKREILRERLGDHYNPKYMFDGISDDEKHSNNADSAYLLAQDAKKRPFKQDLEFGKGSASTRKRKIINLNFKGLMPNSTNSWICAVTKTRVDLSLKHYPRYYRAVECSQTRCYRDYTCRQAFVPLKFLKLRGGACQRRYGVGATVEEIWELITINVPVACECGY